MEKIEFAVISQKRHDPQTFQPFIDFCVAIPSEFVYHLMADGLDKNAAVDLLIETAKTSLEQEIRKNVND